MSLEIRYVTNFGTTSILELAEDSSLEIESVSPLFDINLSEGCYSLPLSAPWSESNRRNLGAPEMLESLMSEGEVFWECTIYRDGVVEMNRAKMTLISVIGDLDYRSGSYSLAITGPESLFGSLIKNLKISDLHLGGPISYSIPSREFAYNVMTGLLPAVREKLGFAPVLNTEFFDTGREDYDGEAIEKGTINQVFLDSTAGTWCFGCGRSSSPADLALPGDIGYNQFRTVPLFRFFYILREIFISFGYSVTGSLFSDITLNNLYIDNNFALEVYQAGTADLNRTIYPRNHVPDVFIADFLEAVSQVFNFKIDWLAHGVVSLDFKKKPADIIDLTEHTDIGFEAEFTEEKSDGIAANFKFPSDDGAVSDRIKDIDINQIRGTFASISDVVPSSFSPTLKDGDLILVRNENYYYRFSGEFGHFIYHAEAFNPVIMGKGGIEIMPEASPLLQAVGTTETGVNFRLNMVEKRGPGSYFNNRRILVSNPASIRFFFIESKLMTGYAVPIPVSSNAMDNLSLTMHADNGIFAKYWNAWYRMLAKTRIVTASIRIPVDYSLPQLFRACIKVGTYFFIIKKARYAIGNNEPAEVELIKI